MVKLNIPYGQVTCGRDQFPIIVVRGIAKGIIVGILLSDCLKELHFVVIAVLCKCLYGLVRVDIITVEGDILFDDYLHSLLQAFDVFFGYRGGVLLVEMTEISVGDRVLHINLAARKNVFCSLAEQKTKRAAVHSHAARMTDIDKLDVLVLVCSEFQSL